MKLPRLKILAIAVAVLIIVIVIVVAVGLRRDSGDGPVPTPVVEEPSLNVSVQNVEAKDDLTDAAYSRTRGLFYVSSVDESKLYVINPETANIEATIETPNPSRMLFSADESFLYTSDGTHVRKISTTAFDVDTVVKVSRGTYEMELTRDGKYLFVVNEYADTVTVLDPQTLELIKDIPVDRRPVAIAMSTGGEYAFVANYDDGTITKISLSNLTVVATIPDMGRPVKLMAYPTNDTILVLDEYGNQIIAFNAGDNSVSGKIAVVHYPSDFSLDRDNNRIYIASYTDGEIGVLDIGKEQLIKVVPIGSALTKNSGLNIVLYAPGKDTVLTTNTNAGEVNLVKIKK